jgi:hypothetical protein
MKTVRVPTSLFKSEFNDVTIPDGYSLVNKGKIKKNDLIWNCDLNKWESLEEIHKVEGGCFVYLGSDVDTFHAIIRKEKKIHTLNWQVTPWNNYVAYIETYHIGAAFTFNITTHKFYLAIMLADGTPIYRKNCNGSITYAKDLARRKIMKYIKENFPNDLI